MPYTADLHLHSPYAIGTSRSLSLESLSHWAALKGIDLLATADFTHPAWLRELESKLVTLDDGFFRLRGSGGSGGNGHKTGSMAQGPRFVLGTEVCCVYEQDGRMRRLHLLLLAPDFHTVHRLCATLSNYGALDSDGRPLLQLSARDFVDLALSCNPRCEVIPAHAWTPWFGVYGSKSGFDSLQQCFGDMLPHVHAIETGLSSDPAMNWRIPELGELSIVSFSDAHSAPRLGREMTAFRGESTYEGLREALRTRDIAYTVELYPQEGKYHYDGHRKCGVAHHPSVSLKHGDRCPVCGRKLTLGVLHRVEALAGPDQAEHVEAGLVKDPVGRRPPFRRLVPLVELIAGAVGKGTETKTVQAIYTRLITSTGSELAVLEAASFDDLSQAGGEEIAEAILLARQGLVRIEPGYDGVYGRVLLGDKRLSAAQAGRDE